MDGETAKSATKPVYALRLRWRNARAVLCGIAFFYSALSVKAAPPGTNNNESERDGKWIHHRVTSGERLSEISNHYLVSVDKIIRWNHLDSEHPWLRVGQKLKIYSNVEPLVRHKIKYVVKRGDSWSRIAKRYDVDQRRLRRYWNQDVPEPLQSGQTIIIWAEPKPQIPKAKKKSEPEQNLEQKEMDPFSPTSVRLDGQSIGRPGRGRLRNGVQLPNKPQLYTRRNPAHSWGSSLTVENLQKAIADFRRDTGFDREIIICDMSRKRGGWLRPHNSHRSGRDVDIRLLLREGIPAGTLPEKISQVDWDATWTLIRALLRTQTVKYIFLVRDRQRELRKAAEAAGTSAELLEKIFQYPRRDRQSIIRHSRGHINHMHVRFICGENEPQCSD